MDYNKYIGLPYSSNGRTEAGLDCWGLVCLFYSQELGIDLPSYSELYSDASSPEVAHVINTHRDTWAVTKTGVPGDLCLFNIYGEPAHVGIYVGDNKFLHAREGRDSVVESLSSAQWSKRFQGFFKYSQENSVQVTGVPHPLKAQVLYDWTAAGTTVEDCANFINQKYSVSHRLAQRLVVLVDGVIIPREQWATTVLQPGQTIAYKSIAEGRNATRLLLTIAVIVVAAYFGPIIGAQLAGAGAGASTIAAYTAVATTAINMAGMALVNAIAPIRMPGQNPDPGSAAGLNLFTGSSNQANRFGAIPVVLGKMRVTGMLGATPYVETLTDTSLINLLIVWGFGPLTVTDICVGTNPISNYYGTEEFGQDFPAPVTLEGYATDDATQFNKLYGRDVEQQQVGVLLVNNAEDGTNVWQNVVLNQDTTTNIDVAFSFPEGMRQLVVSGGDAGQVREATAEVEVQVRKFNSSTNTWGAWTPRASYTHGSYTTGSTPNANEFTETIGSAYLSEIAGSGESSYYQNTPLYQWHTYALSDTGEIKRFSGAATFEQNQEPATSLIDYYKSNSYASLLGGDYNQDGYARLPELPQNGFFKLYTICIFNNQVVQSIDHLAGSVSYTGLALGTYTATTTDGFGENATSSSVGVQVTIASGAINGLSALQPATGTATPIFDTRSGFESQGAYVPSMYSGWSALIQELGVWAGDLSTNFDKTKSDVVFPYSGYYNIEASADDEGAVYINNRQVVGIPIPGYASTVSNLVYLDAGTYPVRVTAKNTNGGNASVACKITYTENGGLNNLPTPDTILVFGAPGFYSKRKDAFNFVYKIKNLSPGKYEVRAHRVNDDSSEPAAELRNYNKITLLSVTAYGNPLDANGNPQGPINAIPNTNLAKTAIRLQSTSKVNGTVDGVNAVVQTVALDWDRTTQTWITRPTSNPASLFAYVLMHPGNAYRIKTANAYSEIDVTALQVWHEYCDDNQFEFNSVITQTQSVLDILRDICAAGKASPVYIDGKWSVIVDKPRSYVTQHFTPHNSWGFESTKVLPRLPDAFRITYADATKAYQANEELIFNFGKTAATAEIFESLSLPGVTNARQARHLARWHLAQLKLRPEVYSLNVDFEYLVCTRGDLVRVSHDVPLWGTGTGRIKAIAGNTLTLTEPVYLTAGKTYQIRIRVNTISTTAGTDSVLKTVATISATDWYNTITLTTAPGNTVEVDNLYMIGEVSKESQQLIVLSIEPSTNTSAKLTLADYSPEIYSINMNSDDELPSFNANIDGQSISIAQRTITQAPIITGAISGSSLAEEISTGTFQNILIVSFGNVAGLSIAAEKIQLQVVLGDIEFDSNSLFGVYEIDKSAGSLSIAGLKTLTIYKIRARYINSSGSISGPWSDIFYTTSQGKTQNTYTAPTISLDLEGTYIVATPAVLDKPSDFQTYEYRLYKDSGTEDFWDLDITTNNILVTQNTGIANFNLLDMPLPRISETGITYRVACRALDRTNNYSAVSALGTIVVTTIK